MRAVRIHTTGGPDVLQVDDLPEETPPAGHVRVDIAAAGVNFIDTYQRSGLYPLPLPARMGREGAGVVSAVGDGVDEAMLGERVAWAAINGSYAESAVLPVADVVTVPEAVDLRLAAAVMLQGLTAHYLSASVADIRPGTTTLVYAPAGGTGRLLVQLLRRKGARIIACTSSEEKGAIARRMGADEVVLYRDGDMVQQVRALTDGAGVEVVYDSVGRDTFERSLDCLRPRGLMVLYGGSSGPVAPVDPQDLNRRGSLYLTRPALSHFIADREELTGRADELFALVGSGELEVTIHAEYPLAEAAQAHRDIESGTTMGKLLLLP